MPRPSQSRPRSRPSERLEVEIARKEQAVADLEQRLATDWQDVDALAAHRRTREELKTMIARWEELFEQAQA